jgi:hypothetical protein
MNTPDAVWGGLIAVGVAFEAYTLRNKRGGDTLSETTRRAFRVHTKTGKIVFATAWGGFAVWYLGHILYGWDFLLT